MIGAQRPSNISTSSAKTGNVPLGSPFVEDFKVKLQQPNATRDLTLHELKGHFVECSLD
jgi:hypothetical protein